MWNKNERTTLLILIPLVLSIAISMDIFVPSIPSIVNYFHSKATTVQWTLTIFMFGSGIGQLIFGPLVDRFGRRKIVLIGTSIYFIGTLLCFFAPSINLLILARLFQSIGACSLIVVAYAIVRDIYSVEKGATMYSKLGSVTMIAPVTAPLLGGYLMLLFNSWRATFGFLLLFAIVTLIVSYCFISETLKKEQQIKINLSVLIHNYFTVFKNGSFRLYSFITLMCITALFCFCAISPYLLISELQISVQLYGLCFGLNAIVFIIASLLSNRLSNQFSMQKTVLFGVLFSIIGSVWMLIINDLNGLSVLNFMLPMMMLSFGLGLSFGPATALALANFSQLAGTASALLTSIQFLGAGIIGSLLTIHGVHNATPFAILMVVMTILALLFLQLRLLIKS
ncbi:multidrug effflux MFS transporter [Thiotrichales bacterium 19X7-9]|nr:multidrug effflux MFS transporter [Thiotrichales bacterium 19X7-9]